MNYIKHLNAVFKRFSKDSRLNPTHLSLYVALFQFWNINRFSDVFYINRGEIMQMAKIGSKNTYHRCLKNLNDWSYIIYLPSHNPYKSSQVKMLTFSTSIDTSTGTSTEPVMGQALVPDINVNKQNTNGYKLELPEKEIEVLEFFKKENWSLLEGKKFYNHYNSIGWKIGGKIKITNWHSTAQNWMLKAEELKGLKVSTHARDNLKTVKNKNYDEPL